MSADVCSSLKNRVGGHRLFVSLCVFVAELKSTGEVFLRLGIVFSKKMNDSNIVLERYLVRERECLKVRHVSSAALNSKNEVLRETGLVQLEVCLEQ